VYKVLLVIHCMCSLSCTVNDIFSVEYWHDLEILVRSHSRSLETTPFDIHVSHLSYIVTGRILYRFRNKARYWWKTPIFHTPLPRSPIDPFEYFAKIILQTVRLEIVQNTAEKFNPLRMGASTTAYKRQTDSPCHKAITFA